MSGKPSFFSELRRRNVYKVAVAYVVGACALAQGIAQVFPVFDVSNFAIRLIVLLIIIGFPVALAAAWFFEITPEGIKRTAAADAMPQMSGYKNRAWIYIVAVGLIVSLGLFFLGRFSASRAGSAPTGLGTSMSIPAKSIAVLPFENLSEDKANAYFAEGIQDEIVTRLAKIADLKVISRTSTQHYKSSATRNLREIGQALGVAHVLEGS